MEKLRGFSWFPSQVDDELKDWESYVMRHLDKDELARLCKAFAPLDVYHSCAIEQNELSLEEVKDIGKFGLYQPNGQAIVDWYYWEDAREVVQLYQAITMCYPEAVHQAKAIDENYILGLHLHIMKGLISDDIGVAGEYRQINVRVGDYFPCKHEEVPMHMSRLNEFLHDIGSGRFSDVSPIILAGIVHYWFEKIHPFVDGNGRTGRVLMNLILLWHGYPPCIIPVENKMSYFHALQTNDHVTLLIDFMIKTMNRMRPDKNRGRKGLTLWN